MAHVLSVSLVAATDGSIDTDASLASCKAEILKYKAARETEQATIAEQVGALFDEHKGATLNMPYVANEALRRLNVQPENFKLLEARVLQYVRENSQGDKIGEGDSATFERPDSLFVITKGKGGGVKRRGDIPVPAAK